MFLIVGDNFVSPEFNLVLVVAFTLAVRRNTFISCLVDIVAGGFLLYATSCSEKPDFPQEQVDKR